MGLHQIGLDTGIEKSIENNASKNVVGEGIYFPSSTSAPPPPPHPSPFLKMVPETALNINLTDGKLQN